MVTLKGWLKRFGRPVALYTDKHSTFKVNRPPDLNEQLAGEPAQTQFARALKELGIEWIAAHSPQAKGRVERVFETLQDRLVKEMRLAGIRSANQFLENQFLPEWNERFTEPAQRSRDAHRVREMLTGHFAELTTLRRFLVSATHAPSRTTTPFTGTASDGLSHEHRSKPACAELVSTWRDG